MADSKRLLFVDDEDSIRATLPIILRRHGFDVRSAANVREALDEIKRYSFDVLLSDLNIDKPRDGYEVVRAMRQANPLCVAIVLTGDRDSESVERLHRDVDDYFVKPANIDPLVATMKARLAQRQLNVVDTCCNQAIKNP